MTGRPHFVRLMGMGVRRPKVPVPGRDLSGVVEAVGSRVTRFRPGDEVYGVTTVGSFAEYARSREGDLAHKPANLTHKQAAALPISGMTALQGLRDVGHVQPGQQVLVIGAAGGVGSYAVQLAHAFGARVTGMCGTGKSDLVLSIGADDVIDYTREEVDARGPQFDLIIDTAGRRPLALLSRALTPRGTLAIVGGEGGGWWLGGFDRQILRAPLRSAFSDQRLRAVVAKERTEDLEYLTTMIEEGKLTPVIDRTFPLHEAPEQSGTWHKVTPAARSSSQSSDHRLANGRADSLRRHRLDRAPTGHGAHRSAESELSGQRHGPDVAARLRSCIAMHSGRLTLRAWAHQVSHG